MVRIKDAEYVKLSKYFTILHKALQDRESELRR